MSIAKNQIVAKMHDLAVEIQNNFRFEDFNKEQMTIIRSFLKDLHITAEETPYNIPSK